MALTQTYYLKHFDTPLLLFSASTGTANPDIDIIEVYEDYQQLLPYGFTSTNKGLYKWIKRRTIPHNRAYVDSFLAKYGLSLNRPMDIVSVSKGLSLTDCYWISEENSTDTFSEINLYDNPFNSAIAHTAFSGIGSSHHGNKITSPEFTTNGALRKCWRKSSDNVTKLYKGGTEGVSNAGFEPYSEYYAAKIAEVMGINAIDYDIVSWKKIICSTCELFTSKDISFVPIGSITKDSYFETIRDFYADLGDSFLQEFYDMLLFDAVIYNTDRHTGNFGLLIDSHTNKIIAPAPIFDNGNSLFNTASLDCFESTKNLTLIREYASTRFPVLYDDFVQTAVENLDERRVEMLKKVLDMDLWKYQPRYNMAYKRVKIIDTVVKDRVREILTSANML